MSEALAKQKERWRFTCATPAREVFAVMEQMIGTPPFRFEVVDDASARIVEWERKGLFGQWTKRFPPGRSRRWVTCSAVETDTGTAVEVNASGGRGALPRALQLVLLLTQGDRDRRTIYRDRTFPPGPVTLVASWAGMPYRLFDEPRHDAPRSREVLTATPLVCVANHGAFVRVRLADGTEGFVERDQLVPAPAEAVREAQPVVARYS